MADTTYQPKVYFKQGALELVIASGGKLTFETGASWQANSTQAAAISDMTTAHTTNPDAYTATELDTIGSTLDAIVLRLQSLKIIP